MVHNKCVSSLHKLVEKKHFQKSFWKGGKKLFVQIQYVNLLTLF